MQRAEVFRWIRRNVVELCVGTGGLIAIHLIFVADAYRETDTVHPETAGHLGDFVGGYIGTILLLVSVVLLYSTLKTQRQSAAQQYFETKYFELIKMHRDNVAELELGPSSSGRKIFVLLVREYRCIQGVVRRLAVELGHKFSQLELVHISYYVLFFGVGPNSSRMLKSALASFDQSFVDALETELSKDENKQVAQQDRKLRYVPFEGHQSRLGHYYRHLYQTICYVDDQRLDIEKYEYVKTVRAQLTTHEQALLLVNSLTPLGNRWWKKDLIERYRLVQNIPRGFFHPSEELRVDELFGSDYFEWQEVAKEQWAGRRP